MRFLLYIFLLLYIHRTAKIFIFGGPKDYEPALADFIGKENLPANYAGDQPPLNSNIHPYEETMKEYSTTEVFPTSLKRTESNGDTVTVGTTSSEQVDEGTLDPEVLHFANGL